MVCAENQNVIRAGGTAAGAAPMGLKGLGVGARWAEKLDKWVGVRFLELFSLGL
jgi:hypothetical protein